MALSEDGNHPMTKISDTQAVILSTAARRDDGAVLPLPERLKIKGGAVNKVLASLKAKSLIDHQGIPRGDDPPPLCITHAGLEAIGVVTEEESQADAGATEAETTPGASDADPGATSAGVAGAEGQAERGEAADTRLETATRTPRAGTKQAQMIELLKRPEGATVEQIAAATGWQHHTIRGAISGALKKKLGLNIEAARTREVGPNKVGAKGSTTVYRILGPATGPQPSNGSGTETA
jgi:Protein of unknown function (DUF3489)